MPEWVRPGSTDNISDHFADHLRRGSLGGTDWTDGYGTPMRAMRAGVVIMVDSNPDGSGGRMITIRCDDGERYEELHADRFIVTRGKRVEQLQMLGYSGGSGYGSNTYYGPHIHGHGIHPNGVRFDLEPLVYRTGTAGGGVTIIMAWTPDEWAAVRWVVDATEGEAENDNAGPRTSLLATVLRRLADHVMPQVTALWSWSQGWKYGEGETAQDSALARLLRRSEEQGGIATATDVDELREAVGKLGTPTITVHADASVFVEALKDPAVIAALGPAIARYVVDELGTLRFEPKNID